MWPGPHSSPLEYQELRAETLEIREEGKRGGVEGKGKEWGEEDPPVRTFVIKGGGRGGGWG